ncbi:hypothetical protein J6590_003811 [Homalodisca vitripennis]|nr:hypothetical protein J6590_003811 [Homalodisca vitripennis]
MNPRISTFAVSDVPLLDIHKVAQIEVTHRFLLYPVVDSTGSLHPYIVRYSTGLPLIGPDHNLSPHQSDWAKGPGLKGGVERGYPPDGTHREKRLPLNIPRFCGTKVVSERAQKLHTSIKRSEYLITILDTSHGENEGDATLPNTAERDKIHLSYLRPIREEKR